MTRKSPDPVEAKENTTLKAQLRRLEQRQRRQSWTWIVLCAAVFLMAQVSPKVAKPGDLKVKQDIQKLKEILDGSQVNFKGKVIEADAFVVTDPLTRKPLARLARNTQTGFPALELLDRNGHVMVKRQTRSGAPGPGVRSEFLLEHPESDAEMRLLVGRSGGSLRTLDPSGKSQVNLNGDTLRLGPTDHSAIGPRGLTVTSGQKKRAVLGVERNSRQPSLLLKSKDGKSDRLALGLRGNADRPEIRFFDESGTIRLDASLDQGGVPSIELENP